jgi:branched-chain amino acid transport system permease protein
MRILPYAVVAAIAGEIVYANEPVWIQLAIGVTISAILAIAWDILSRTGQVSLATAAFFGLGAYSTAMLEPIFGVVVAWIGVVVTCSVTAMLLGFVTLRLRRMYFGIATLGFTLSLQVGVLALADWTGGAGGIAPPVIANGEPGAQLALIAGLLLAAMAVSDGLMTIRFRPAFFMIRTKPELAAACGVPVVRTKILAFVVSGILSGLAGGCYGGLYGYVVPTDVFTTNWSVLPLAVTILGGMDTTIGPLLGAALLRALEEIAKAVVGGTGYQVVYGLVIIVFVMLLPQGIAGVLKQAAERFRPSGAVAVPRTRTTA